MSRPRLNSSRHSPYAGAEAPSTENTGKATEATLKSMDDTTLMKSLVRGDLRAMAEIYDRYAHLSMAIAQRILGDTALAEQVVGEILLQIWRQPTGYSSACGELTAWVALATRNHAHDLLQNGSRSATLKSIPFIAPRELMLSGNQVWLQDKLNLVIANLPHEQQTILELAWYKRLNINEIAKQTELSPEIVKVHIQSSLKTLQRALELHD